MRLVVVHVGKKRVVVSTPEKAEPSNLGTSLRDTLISEAEAVLYIIRQELQLASALSDLSRPKTLISESSAT